MFYKLHFPFKSLQKYKLITVRKLPYINFKKMKKIIGILGIAVFAMTLFMNAAVLTNDSNEPEFKTTSFTTIAFANVNEGENCSSVDDQTIGKLIRTSSRCNDSDGEPCGLAYVCTHDASAPVFICSSTSCN